MGKLPDLKPCPFCDGPASLSAWEGAHPEYCFVECVDPTCGCSVTEGANPVEAAARWNHRPGEVKARLDGLRVAEKRVRGKAGRYRAAAKKATFAQARRTYLHEEQVALACADTVAKLLNYERARG